jgi:predicted DNA-binding protein YlxM (UPF0122 family)
MPKVPVVLREGTLAEIAERRVQKLPTWEQLLGETQHAYTMFLNFLATRDYDAVAKQHGVSKQAVYDIAHRWCWNERLQDYNRYLVRLLTEQIERDLAESMHIALSYLRRELMNEQAAPSHRLRCAEIILRYSILGRPSPVHRINHEIPSYQLTSNSNDELAQSIQNHDTEASVLTDASRRHR